MAVSIIQSPADISFSRNHNWWGFKTDNLYSNAGTVSVFLLSFPGGPMTDGQAFDLTYNDILQTLIAKDAPDTSGLQIRSGAGLSLLDWCNQFIEDLKSNFLISRDYVIELDLLGVDPRVKLTAKLADPIYDIELNDQDFVNSTMLANGIKKAKHPSFGIWYQLLVTNEDNTGFEVVLDKQYLDVNDDGEAFPDLSETLTSALIGVFNDYEQPDPAMPVVQRNRKSCRRYYMRYAEAYGSKQVIRKVSETAVKWVMFGGTGKAKEKNYSIATAFFADGYHKFLKQEATTKTVTKKQCEWLGLVWLTGPIDLVNLRVKTYFTVGDPVTHTAFTTEDLLQYDKVTFPAGATQLNLFGLYDDKIITFYEVWLADAANERVSEIRTYQVNYEYQPYALWFSSLSSLGCYDTFVTTGAGSTEYDLITQRATLTQTNTFKFEHGETMEFGNSLDLKLNVLSGWIRTKRELKRYRDFFLSWNRFQVKYDRAYPVYVNSKSIKEYQDDQNLFYIDFEIGYRFSEETWSEEDDDVAPVVPLNVSQFWPVISNPDPENFDHLYYRKTATLNTAEILEHINNVLTIEANNHAIQSGQITALQEAMAGKSNTDHLHDGIYLPVGEFDEFVVEVGAALFYKGAWVAGYNVDPDPETVVLPGYAINDVVDMAGTLWRSLLIENIVAPGTDPAKWEKIIYSKIPFEVAAPVTVNWQADLIPGKPYTWAQKYGNDLPGVAGAWWLNPETSLWELFGGFQLNPTYAGDSLLTVDISADLFPLKINII